ncbi:hypothetical protein QAD02_023156 [Eretmocerus hayati]|uniref:Uncharacterized protein n=1 Tax=Eretmocerus hayati TaxID=131215 RepID=A0ACC2PVD8_9HYME|nr:hypothetical protein QAD02_023156 [Eretmocerus hayati]
MNITQESNLVYSDASFYGQLSKRESNFCIDSSIPRGQHNERSLRVNDTLDPSEENELDQERSTECIDNNENRFDNRLSDGGTQNLCEDQFRNDYESHISSQEQDNSQEVRDGDPPTRDQTDGDQDHFFEARSVNNSQEGNDGLPRARDQFHDDQDDSTSSQDETNTQEENDDDPPTHDQRENRFDQFYDSSDDEGDHRMSENIASILATVMFESAGLSVKDVIVMVQTLAVRFQLSDEASLKFMQLFKLCAGPKMKDINLSKYLIAQVFHAQNSEKITYVYYCQECRKRIILVKPQRKSSKKEITCESCAKKNELSASSPNYFISIDFKYQLEILLRNEQFLEMIMGTLARRHDLIRQDDICDFDDGKLFGKIISSITLEPATFILFYDFGTDGAPLTRSGKRGFWPLQVTLNDLPPKLRLRFVLLLGVLLTPTEPTNDLINLFLTPFITQLRYLYYSGISVDYKGTKIRLRFCPLNIPVDSVCRPIMQNRIQHSGYAGDNWCYHPGIHFYQLGMRYPILEIDPELRTHESHLRDIQLVEEKLRVRNAGNVRTKRPKNSKETTSMGVKGPTVLLRIPHHDIVWSFSYEYLHGSCLGIDPQIWNLWRDFEKLSATDIKAIQVRLKNIRPNRAIHRLQLPISDRKKWKASLIKSWILYYSLPCLYGILPEEDFEHYKLFVRVLFTLLKTRITKAERQQCKVDSLRFVGQYQLFYGAEFITSNVHAFLHAVDSVEHCGPSWTNSAFPQESNIFSLKQFVTGSNGMDFQMAKKSLLLLQLKTVHNLTDLSPAADEFCGGVFTRRRLSIFSQDDETKTTFIGRGRKVIVNRKSYESYDRCILKSEVFHSTNYTRDELRDDTFVKMDDGKYGRIFKILKEADSDRAYFQLIPVSISTELPFSGIHHIKKIDSEDINSKFIVSADRIESKVLHIDVRYSRFVCEMPNSVEVQ